MHAGSPTVEERPASPPTDQPTQAIHASRSRIDAWLLFGAHAPSERFWEDATARNAASLRGMVVSLALIMLLWWPTDAIVFADRPEFRLAYLRLRLSYVTLCVVTFGILGTKTGKRHPVLLLTLSTCAFSYATVWSLGRSIIDEGWFYAAYIVPFATAPLLMPLRQRIASIGTMVTFWLALLFTTVGTDLPSSVSAPYLAYASFTSLAALVLGHLVYYHAADAFDLRERLAELNLRLEDRVAASTRELRALARRAVNEREAESRVLASELHDDVGQVLAGLRIELGLLARILREDDRAEHVQRLSDLVDRLAQAVRTTLLRLRPRILDDLGPIESIRWLADETQRGDGPAVQVECTLRHLHVTDEVGLAMFRVVQEALTNVVRHARAQRVILSIVRDDGKIRVTVSDDGIGGAYDRAQGLGLLGMRERAHACGGTLRIEPAEPHGTVVTLELPETS